MTPQQSPRIAVVVPCYNDGATLIDTVASVDAQEPCELIVVDDGSSDPHTIEVMERLEDEGRKVIRKKNEGLSAARMTGIAAAAARYIYPLDADDMLMAGALAKLADALDEHPEHAACWGDERTFGEVAMDHRSASELDPWLVTHLNPMSYSALFRRSALEEVGGWELKGGYEDWDIWMKLAEHGLTGFRVPVQCLRYRVHGQRMWADASQRHDEIHANLASRHPDLFAARARNWKRSRAPLLTRLAIPVVARLPLSAAAKRRLFFIAREPRAAAWLGLRRVAAAVPGTRVAGDDTLILCYHAVSDSWPAPLSVSPQAFEAQIRAKMKAGYEPMTLSEARSPERSATKALVITFDDGYRSTLTVAAPILEEMGAPATLFVPTDYMDRSEPMRWPGIDQWLDGPHRDELMPLSWAELRSLADRGWEIGSHSCSHPRLTALDDESLRRELTLSRETVERELGRPCPAIAYPYGDTDERVSRAARDAGYELGAGLPARWNEDGDPMQLPRVGVYNEQASAYLRLKTSRSIRRLRATLGR